MNPGVNCKRLLSIGLLLGIVLSAGAAAQNSHDYPVKHDYNVLIPMRDGVKLSADIYRPDAEGRFPVVLSRTPYSNNSRGHFKIGTYFARHGYAYVTEDSRGRMDSEGVFVPLINEAQDGYDTMEWVAAQPWSTGDIGTIGGSYGAWNQWLTASEGNSHLKAMVSLVAPPDPFLNVPYQNGAFLMAMSDWMILVDGRSMQDLKHQDFGRIYRHLPLSTLDEAAGRHSQWWRDWTHHDTYDDYWKQVSYQDKYDRIKVPVLHITGWYDDDQIGTMMNYPAMVAHAGTAEARRWQSLLVGPWPHAVNSTSKLGDIDFGPTATIDINATFVQWFDCQLKHSGCDQLATQAPVRIFVMGDNRWRDEQEWPLARATYTPYYFHSQGKANRTAGDGRLTTAKPEAEPPDHYAYDPNDPTPFILVPGALQLGTTEDQRAVEARSDVLVFTSDPLPDSLEVTGPIRIKLWAASSAPDTDWTGKLVDVHPDGYAQRLLDGIIRARFRESYEHPTLLQPQKIYEYTIDLWATSNVFLKGHQIRVEIASASFPKFARNLNTGESNEESTRMQVAQQTVYHDAAHPSHVLLPIIPRP